MATKKSTTAVRGPLASLKGNGDSHPLGESAPQLETAQAQGFAATVAAAASKVSQTLGSFFFGQGSPQVAVDGNADEAQVMPLRNIPGLIPRRDIGMYYGIRPEIESEKDGYPFSARADLKGCKIFGWADDEKLNCLWLLVKEPGVGTLTRVKVSSREQIPAAVPKIKIEDVRHGRKAQRNQGE